MTETLYSLACKERDYRHWIKAGGVRYQGFAKILGDKNNFSEEDLEKMIGLANAIG